MALIKCEECGQMVSDRAKACPQCGCPLLRAESHQEGQPQQMQQMGQSHISDDSKGKPGNMSMRWLLVGLAVLAVLSSAAVYAWQSGLFHPTASAADSVAVDSAPIMAAPTIALNGDGLYSIEDCPTTYKGLEIFIHKLDGIVSSVDVVKDGQMLSSFSFGEDDGVTGEQVHFLDANFDGYVDFMLGPGCAREWSALFLWNVDKSRFLRATADGGSIFNGIFQFQPASQKVFARGSGSFSSSYVCRMSWSGTNLITEEMLTEEMLRSRIDDSQPARYVIHAGEKIIFKSNDPGDIPDRWKKWAWIPTPEEEAQYEEASQSEMAIHDEYDEYNEHNDSPDEDYGRQDEKQSKADKEKRARIARYESRIQEGINELNYMLKTGQMNPMNIIFLKQSLPNEINDVIRMYCDLGDYDKANQWTNELHYIESILSQLNV